MKLSLTQIEQITKGAVRIEEKNGAVQFYRFTKEQEELYKERSADYYMKSFASAGIKFIFKTNSENVFLKVFTQKGSSRSYFSFDVYVNGNVSGYLNNYSDIQLPIDYTELSLRLGEFSKNFELGKGDKTVCIYLPWSVKTELLEMSLDDEAYIEPVNIKKKILMFGDSITQGYDALRPASRYATRLAEYLNAEEINKGISGEKFFPKLAETKEDFQPNYITVAYGTNDWNHISREEFVANCKGFYMALCETYPQTPIFAFTPIWRKDYQGKPPFGPFEDVEKEIRLAVKDLGCVTVISGWDFVPKDATYYADGLLHPNDMGFDYYSENVLKEIASKLKYVD